MAVEPPQRESAAAARHFAPMRMHRTNQALLVVWATIAAFLGYLAFGLVSSQREVERRTRAQAVSYVRLVEQHASAAFERSDLALLGAIDHLRAEDLRSGMRLSEARRKELDVLLRAQQQRTTGIVAMPLADANGDVVANSHRMGQDLNVADRSNFRSLKQNPSAELVISEAVQGPQTKRWAIIVSRRLSLPDKQFGGMVGAVLDLNQNFLDFYSSLPLGRNASVSLRDPENRLLVRYPALSPQSGRARASLQQVEDRLRAGDPEGVLLTSHTFDGVERVLAYRRLAKFPVYAAVGLSLEEALVPWRRERNVALSAALLFLAAGAFITVSLRRNRQAELALIDSEAKFHGLAEQSFIGIAFGSLTGFNYVNPGLARIFGYTQEEMRQLAVPDLATERDKPRVTNAVSERLNGSLPHVHYTFEGRRKDGSNVDIEAYGSRMLIGGKPLAISILVDISERRRVERALERESARTRLLLRTASDGIHVLDAAGNVIEASDAFCRMLGYEREMLLGSNASKWDVGSWPGGLLPALRRMQSLCTETTTFETRYRRRDGTVIEVEVCSIGVEFDREPLLFASARDITERKRAQERAEHQAQHDALTGVPNRVLFYDRLSQGITRARRERHELALLFVDLDDFKAVNDSLGHMAGDELLKITAARIRASLRESDTVARVGGDEFTVILPRVASRDDAAEVAAKIIQAVSQPCKLSNSHAGAHEVAIGASIGIAFFPSDAEDADRLVEAADAVMYEAKRKGNSFCFCQPG